MKEKVYKKGLKRRLLSIVLALAMVFSLLPMNSTVAKATAAPTPLTFTAVEAGSKVTFNWSFSSGSNVMYCIDGTNWTTYEKGTTITLENKGDKVSFKGLGVKTDYNHFVMEGKIAASGDVTSLSNEVGGDVTLDYDCYYQMFSGCTSLVSAPNLPSTILARSCYKEMFRGCTNLVNAPNLPATTLASYCYCQMFSGCTNLVSAPSELPADELKEYCYYQMFENCTSLVSAPELKAATMANYCCGEMFKNCISLVSAPALPAETMADYCYDSMFIGCMSLISAPALPATSLADGCYYSMFSGCTSLSSAPALLATSLADSCYENMFSECTSLSSAPALPATSLAGSCYDGMFYGCTSLVSAPALPATSLATQCYDSMFYGCTSLVSAPNLPATSLAGRCYSYMFSECTSLIDAPSTLPATSLADSCYNSMFYECSSLSSVPNLSATTLASYSYSYMFGNCTNLKVVETTDPSEAIWTFPSEGVAGGKSNMISGVTTDGTFTQVEAGKMYKVTAIKDIQTLSASNVIASYGDTDKKITVTNDRTDGGALSYEVTDGTDVIEVDESGNITIKKVGNAIVKITAAATETYAVAEKSINVRVNKLTPVVPSAVAVAPTSAEASDGKITGVNNTMEYATYNSATSTYGAYADVAGTEITNLAAGTKIKVRVKATENNNPSADKELTVPSYKAPTPPSGGGGGYYAPSIGGGSTSENNNSNTTTTINPDGSTTTTTKNPDGSTATTTKNTDGSTIEVTKAADGTTTTIDTAKDGSSVKTVEQTITNKEGKAVENVVVTNTDANGKVTGSTETSKIADVAPGMEATIVVAKTATGEVSKAIAGVKAILDNPKSVTFAANTIAQLIEAASGKNIIISLSVYGGGTLKKLSLEAENDKPLYTVNVDSSVIKANTNLKIFMSKDDNYYAVNNKNYKVDKDGSLQLNITSTKGNTFELVDTKTANSISKEILKEIKPAKTSLNVKKGKNVTMKLADSYATSSVKSITYTTSNKKVATVNKNGKVVAKKAGKVTIKALVTLKNGKTKTVKTTVKVK